jgi:hypothetical protein
MDAAFLLILTCASLFCWLIAIFDSTTPIIYRASGIVAGVPVLVWYLVFVMGSTKSPVWNNIEGGPVAVVALAFGVIAFMSRKKPRKDESHQRGIAA